MCGVLAGFGVFAYAETLRCLGRRARILGAAWLVNHRYNQLEDISAPNRESTIEFASPRSGLSDRPGSRSASYASKTLYVLRERQSWT